MRINPSNKSNLNQYKTVSTINQGLTEQTQKSFAQSYPQASFPKQAF